MSKRRRKARGRTGGLPLDSRNWMPAAEAHRMLTGSVGDSDLAAKDLTAAVADRRPDKRLPCMQRAIASYIAPAQDREIVPLSFWDKYEFIFDPVIEKLRVCKREAHVLTPVGLAGEDAAFFVWRPKFKKIWPALAASAAPPATSSARDDEPTPAPTARIDDKQAGAEDQAELASVRRSQCGRDQKERWKDAKRGRASPTL